MQDRGELERRSADLAVDQSDIRKARERDKPQFDKVQMTMNSLSLHLNAAKSATVVVTIFALCDE